jgi:serralysin
MATIIQTTDINVGTSPVISLATGDYFYQFAGLGLSTTDASGPAISASGSNDTVEIHGSVFSPGVAVGGPVTTFIVASTGSVSGGSTGLQALFTSAQSHYTIDGSVTGGTFGIDSSGSPLYLHVGSTGTVTGLMSNAINLSQTLFGVIDGSVSGVVGIGESSTSGAFNLTVSQGGKVTGTSSYGISFNNYGNVTIDGQVVGGNGMTSNTTGQVRITVGTTGSVAGTFGDGIDVSAQSASIVVNGEVTGLGTGIAAQQTFGTTNIMVGASGFVSGFTGIDVENDGTIGVAGVVNGNQFWGITTGQYNQLGEIYVYAGGLVTGGGANNGAIRVRGSHRITNDGTVSSTDGVGVLADGAGYLLNTGKIMGSTVGIVYTDTFDPNDVLTTVNTGMISGGPNPQIATGPNFFAYDAVGNFGTDRFINQGTVIGDVRLGQHAGSNLVNAGALRGSVYLGSGGQVANSTFGTVSGLMVGGTGADTIVGGKTGGSLLGGAGDDMLYANPTQDAANNHAMTMLDGGTGTNALYGGGGYNTFIGGDTNGGYNQIWGGASGMMGVSGFTNNTIDFSALNPSMSVYVDLLNGHNALINSGQNQSGSYTYEDSIINVPNVKGSSSGDIIQADNGIDRVQGNGGADSLYAGTGPSSQDTFVYTNFTDSNLIMGYDTIANFKIGIDKIDLSALHTDASHLFPTFAGTANTIYVEVTPGTFNAATDLAISVNATTNTGLQASDFVF